MASKTGFNPTSKIMKYHKLLMEVSENKEEYLRRFETENKMQQLFKTNLPEKSPTLNNNYVSSKKFNQYISDTNRFNTHTSTNEEDIRSRKKSHKERLSEANYYSAISVERQRSESGHSKNYASTSKLDREKDYNRLFTQLEENFKSNNVGAEEGVTDDYRAVTSMIFI